jgi:ABC-2 type transport system permease protein
MPSIATIAFAHTLLLPRGAEALAAAIAVVVAASILNAQPAPHTLTVTLPVHYWQNWTTLFDSHGAAQLGTGTVAQVGTIVISTAWPASSSHGETLRHKPPKISRRPQTSDTRQAQRQ